LFECDLRSYTIKGCKESKNIISSLNMTRRLEMTQSKMVPERKKKIKNKSNITKI